MINNAKISKTGWKKQSKKWGWWEKLKQGVYLYWQQSKAIRDIERMDGIAMAHVNAPFSALFGFGFAF